MTKPHSPTDAQPDKERASCLPVTPAANAKAERAAMWATRSREQPPGLAKAEDLPAGAFFR